MTESSSRNRQTKPVSAAAWFGLFIALFGMLIARQIVFFLWQAPNFTSAICREGLMWLCATALLLIIKRGEHLPLRSVGIGTSSVKKSLLWGAVITVVCALVATALVAITHFHGGSTGEAFAKLPTWLIGLIVLRAGVVEELFYRGYAIERLQALGLHRYLAAAIPLLVFGVGHWTNGWANIVIALALGAVLTAFYLWRRDLIANIIGHFLVDFLANVLPRVFS